MTTTAIQPATRLRTAAGLVRLAWFLLTHRSAPVPVAHMNIRVPDAPRGTRLTYLGDVASAYRTHEERRFGSLVAERRFGPVTVEAHVKDEDYTRQLIARIDARRAVDAEAEASA